MGTTLRDSTLRTLFNRHEHAQRRSSAERVSTAEAQAMLEALTDGGRVTDAEARDLRAVLGSGLRLSKSAKTSFEAVAATLPKPFTLTGLDASGFDGVAKPGAVIEAINLTTAPAGRIFTDEAATIGRARADGTFLNAVLPDLKEGDVVRMRARHRDGSASEWFNIRAKGLSAKDAREAVVALDRIALEPKRGGRIELTNLNTSRQISEPGAVLQFRNTRTGAKVRVTVNDVGSFDEGLVLKGRAGDDFAVAVSDGVHNTRFSEELPARVTVPGRGGNQVDLVSDPTPTREERNHDGSSKFSKQRFVGPLFRDGVSPHDVQQGWIEDCYFPAAMGALADVAPQVIKDMVNDHGDGTYTVKFREGRASVEIKVDADLYVRPSGAPLYGGSDETHRSAKSMELWHALVEKAWAAWYGSYHDIGQGGSPSEVFEAVLGKPGVVELVRPSSRDRIWNELKAAVDSKRPSSLTTHGEERDSLYKNTGLYSDHAYSVLGYKETGGKQLITLRNPWGESEPSGNGKNDGVFDIDVNDAAKYFDGFHTVEAD